MKPHISTHPTAIISAKARIGEGTQIGPFCLVHDNVEIGENCVIEGFCELGHPTHLADGSPLRIGPNSLVRSHSTFYEGSTFGERLVTGHYVCVRELTRAGCNLQIGSKGDIQGHCVIGDYVRTHSNVHIGQKSSIGNFVWLFPDVLLTNDPNPPSEHLEGPTIGDFAVVCSKATLLPGVRVGSYGVVGAHALVSADVPDFMFANGAPAKVVCRADILRMKHNPGMKAYPWKERFNRGYPEAVVMGWKRSPS